jgi:hypothetical protein
MSYAPAMAIHVAHQWKAKAIYGADARVVHNGFSTDACSPITRPSSTRISPPYWMEIIDVRDLTMALHGS